jgi:beta-phosphoglucomutase-like phosphatase (HAD superfamily)
MIVYDAILFDLDVLFDLTVDGRDVARLGLSGKPSPDGFLEAARRLDVAPPLALRAAGADLVVDDLSELVA